MREGTKAYIDNLLASEIKYNMERFDNYKAFLTEKYGDDIEAKMEQMERVVYEGRQTELAYSKAVYADFKQHNW